MDKATMGTYLEMFRVLKFVIDTRSFALIFVQKTKLKIEVSMSFVIVIGWEILRKESVLLASLFI
jgi:hypothetical protein